MIRRVRVTIELNHNTDSESHPRYWDYAALMDDPTAVFIDEELIYVEEENA